MNPIVRKVLSIVSEETGLSKEQILEHKRTYLQSSAKMLCGVMLSKLNFTDTEISREVGINRSMMTRYRREFYDRLGYHPEFTRQANVIVKRVDEIKKEYNHVKNSNVNRATSRPDTGGKNYRVREKRRNQGSVRKVSGNHLLKTNTL